MNAFKEWVKKHRILVLIITVALIVAIAAGIFAFIKIREKSGDNASENGDTALHTSTFPDDYSVETAPIAKHAYEYANDVVKEIAMKGVDPKDPNTLKIEDNMTLYIDSLDSDYEKLYFELYMIYLLAVYEDTDRASFLLELFEEKKPELDKNQRYIYLRTYRAYYEKIGDEEKSKEYNDLFWNDPEFIADEYIYVDYETGEVINDEEQINRTKETLEKLKENGDSQ